MILSIMVNMIMMQFNKCVLVIFISILFLPVAVAESGTIIINNNPVTTYAITHDSLNTPNLSKIVIDSADYNVIYSFDVVFNAGDVAYAQSGEMSNFNVTSCGSGSGVVSYSQSERKLSYNFNGGASVSCSPIVLTLDTPSVLTNLSWYYTPATDDNALVISSKPVAIYATSLKVFTATQNPGSNYHDLTYTNVSVGVSTVNYYTINHLANNWSTWIVEKNNIGTKVIVNNGAGNTFGSESTFNTNTFSGILYQGSGSVWLNISISSGGAYTYQEVSTSSGSGGESSPSTVGTNEENYNITDNILVGFEPGDYDTVWLSIEKYNTTYDYWMYTDYSEVYNNPGTIAFPMYGNPTIYPDGCNHGAGCWNNITGRYGENVTGVYRVNLVNYFDNSIIVSSNFTIVNQTSPAPTPTPTPEGTIVPTVAPTPYNPGTSGNFSGDFNGSGVDYEGLGNNSLGGGVTLLNDTIGNMSNKVNDLNSTIQGYNKTSIMSVLTIVVPRVYAAIPDKVQNLGVIFIALIIVLIIFGRSK